MKIIEIKNCSIVTPHEKVILDNFSLALERLEHTAIIGPNGSGKSTLIRMLTKELNPSFANGRRPQIKIMGQESHNIFSMRREVLLVSPKFAENILQVAPISVEDAIASAFLGTYGFFFDDEITKSQQEKVKQVMQKLDLWRLRNSSIEELSTGELRKILIARAMVLEPKLILLDEPTSGLDIAAQSDFLKYLKQLTSQTTVIMVTHHLEEVIAEIKKVLLIKDGKTFKFGDKNEVLTSENMSQLFGCEIELQKFSDGRFSMFKK